MVVILMKKNKKFKIIFKNQDNQVVDLDYYLHDSIIAEKWFSKIKHLRFLKIDENESEISNFSNLQKIYKDFCQFAKIQPMPFDTIDQKLLNNLHEIFEKSHDRLSKLKDNSILYQFHHAIHYHESKSNKQKTKISVGWGTKEGLLTENFRCNEHYESYIQKNNVYLPWSELGKKPLDYWQNNEPANQIRFNELAKPHITLRAKFFISTEDTVPLDLDNNFIKWFETFKNNWLQQYNLTKWDKIDEHSAPLLAIADHNESLVDYKFLDFEL